MIACAAPFHLLDILPFIGATAGCIAFYGPRLKQQMQKIFPFILAFSFYFTAGCANAWKVAYVGGSTAASFVTDTHKQAWSKPLNAKAEECSASLTDENTKADFDACLGIYTENDKVVKALEAYNAASEVLETVLLATDPENPDKAKLLTAWTAVLDAALNLVALFPEGAKYTSQLQTLTKGL